MGEEGVVIRPMAPGDVQGVRDLFQRSFGQAMPEAVWRWKYEQNPFGNGHNMVAVRGRRVVAHYGAYPVPMYDACDGRSLWAFHVGDIMTASEVRAVGVGKRSVIARLARAFYDAMCRRRVAFNFGAPSWRHLKLGTLTMDYVPVGPVLQWTYPARTAPARSRRWVPLYRRCRVTSGPVDAETVEAFYGATARHLGLSLQRCRAYVQWRYGSHPLYAYGQWVVEDRKGWAAWGIVRRDGGELLLGDVLCRPDAAWALDTLLGALQAFQPQSPVRLWASGQPPWWRQMLVQVGCAAQPHPLDIHTGLTLFDAAYDGSQHRQRWFYAMGDFDLF